MSRGKPARVVASGGIIFTTIQKFSPENEEYPMLTDRKNVIVIADEAHRTQYGFTAKIVRKEDQDLIKYGYAKYLRDAIPNASFIGFTGTPIEKADKSTPAIFGDYVDKYDIQQAVDDGATVRLLYESRLAKLGIKPEERRKIDPSIEELTEDDKLDFELLRETMIAEISKDGVSKEDEEFLLNNLDLHKRLIKASIMGEERELKTVLVEMLKLKRQK